MQDALDPARKAAADGSGYLALSPSEMIDEMLREKEETIEMIDEMLREKEEKKARADGGDGGD